MDNGISKAVRSFLPTGRLDPFLMWLLSLVIVLWNLPAVPDRLFALVASGPLWLILSGFRLSVMVASLMLAACLLTLII